MSGERRIEKALQSLQGWTVQIIVLLHHSTDDTETIARRYTDCILRVEDAGKGVAFETMLYPSERHAASGSRTKGAHVLRTQLDFFARKLAAP